MTRNLLEKRSHLEVLKNEPIERTNYWLFWVVPQLCCSWNPAGRTGQLAPDVFGTVILCAGVGVGIVGAVFDFVFASGAVFDG